MNLSPVFLMQFKNSIERILHVKGNYNGGVLEMAVVIDENLEREQLQEILPQLLRTLKMHSEVFRNVRLNVVNWKSDEDISEKAVPMAVAGMASYYSDYEKHSAGKDFLKLVQYLKLFQARSKIIMLLTDGGYIGSMENAKSAMQPFLDKKMMQIIVTDEQLQVIYR